MVLSGLQLILLLCVISVRFAAIYFVVAIFFSTILAIWVVRHKQSSRRLVMTKFGAILMVAIVGTISARLLTPSAYSGAGAGSEVLWHRMFIGLGANPDWPFGDLATQFECKPEIPEGLLPGIVDRNGHCAYLAAVKRGAQSGPIYGTQYERLLRRAYWHVVKEYPRQAIETYLLYKPLMLWNTLVSSAQLEISRQTVLILIALTIQVFALLAMAGGCAANSGQLLNISAALVVIGAFSLIPQLLGWSTIATSTDVICYMYIGLALILAGVGRYMFPLATHVQPAVRFLFVDENHDKKTEFDPGTE